MKHWTKGGQPLQVSRVPMQSPTWMWAPSDLAKHRDIFWALVQASRCVLLEFMNPAIRGLVWDRGDLSVLYDAQEVRRILSTKRQPADAALDPSLNEADERCFTNLSNTRWESGTPVLEHD